MKFDEIMLKLLTILPFIVCIFVIIVNSIDIPDDGKLRVCIVESRGIYRKIPKFCPILQATSNIECVEGVDRLDCVRLIHKGSAHFGVLNSEDLIAARWASVEILVTNELRSHNSYFEYELVAVVDNEAGIHTVNDLRGSKLCHPGYGLESYWTEVLANYFESTLVPKSCDTDISLTEDKIRASAKFFGPSCKAGPWVPDLKQDHLLKKRYPSLCQMCYVPFSCDTGDKHWGRRGALYCLTSGGGSVAWARLDDTKSHFGITGLLPQAEMSEYSYLCADGHLQPINTTNPCKWVAKPWPVIAARRSHAAQIQRLVTGVSHENRQGWQHALLSLLETYHVDVIPLDSIIPIDDYLDQAPAFQSAYSFPECNPPRSIVFCTTSIIEHIKCSWLQEASQVYGIQPNIQCVRSINLDTCLDDTKYKAADVVVVDHENRLKAQRDYKLVPLLYEFSKNMHDLYVSIAIVHKDARFKRFSDVKGSKLCLPSYEGPAYLSLLETILNKTGQMLLPHKYFHYDSCTWHPQQKKQCPEYYKGDEGALRCLAEYGDIAILSSSIYKQYTVGNITSTWLKKAKHKSFRVLCPYGLNHKHSKFEYCYLHWTTRGHLMAHNTSLIRQHEIYNSLKHMDALFGKNYKSDTKAFTMYGIFDKHHNVIFKDATDQLKGLQELQNDYNSRSMEDIFEKYIERNYNILQKSKAPYLTSKQILLLSVTYSHIYIKYFFQIRVTDFT